MARCLDRCGLVVAAALAVAALPRAAPALAMEDELRREASGFEDKHVFGFTEGADIGDVGSREAEFTTTVAAGKRGGMFGAIQQEAAFEAAMTDRFGFQATVSGAAWRISQVPGVEDRNSAQFAGLALQPKFIVLRRGLDAPFGLALSLQPQWELAENATGEKISLFSMDSRLYLDHEFIPRNLLGAVNLVYAPEFHGGVGTGALFGASGALSWRVAEAVFAGGEAEVFAAHRSAGLGGYVGSALYLGPTAHVRIAPGASLALAWSAQVAAWPRHAAGGALEAWNGADLARQRARIVFGVEF